MEVPVSSASSRIEVPNQTSNFVIVSEFYIRGSCFLIISLEGFTENSKKFSSNNTTDNTPLSVLGHFDFDGGQFAIVKTQNTLESADPSLTNLLTERELQIAGLIALGWSNKEVGNQLHISEWTVCAHLRRIFIKLNVDSRAAMVYRCSSLINRLHRTMLHQKTLGS